MVPVPPGTDTKMLPVPYLPFPFIMQDIPLTLIIRVAAKIFVFVFSRKFFLFISFVFREIFLQFREIFAEHEIEICAKFKRNSKEISRNAKLLVTSFFRNSLPKSIEKCNFSENSK